MGYRVTGRTGQASRPRLNAGCRLYEAYQRVDWGPSYIERILPYSKANLLSQWLDWRNENPDAFRLVMSRSPEPWERPKLAPLPVDGTLSVLVESRQLPIEAVLANGDLLYRSPVLRGVSDSDLLLALRDATTLNEALEELVHRRTHTTQGRNP